MRKIITPYLFACLSFVSLWGQDAARPPHFIQQGTVRDTKGEPVIGANVRVTDQKGAGVTDADGKFSVPVAGEKATLRISYVGFEEQLIPVERNTGALKIVLAENERVLDDFVVIGYGTQRKTALTSAVEVIKGDDILKVPSPNLDQAINGQVAGLQVMTTIADPSSRREADIRIRGSLNPLLVIDGVPRYGTTSSDEMRLSDLNPDDIESISVLKDAAAAAVYGNRAANGVILVTTKRGKRDNKIRVNYRGQFNVQQATTFPSFVDGYTYAQLYNRAVDNTPGTTYKKISDEDLMKIKNHSAPNEYANENLLDHIKKSALSHTNNLSIQGGSEVVSYFLSGAYTKTEGLYSGLKRDRFNYALRLDVTPIKDLVFSLDLTGSRSGDRNTGFTTLEAMYSSSPIQVLRYTNGRLASLSGSNPLINVYGLGGYSEGLANFSTVTGSVNYKVPWVKGLSVYARGTSDFNVSVNKYFSKPVTLYLYEKDGAGNETFKEDELTIYPKAKTSVQQRDAIIQNSLLEAGANYNRTFSGKHDVSAMLVANYQNKFTRVLDGKNNDLAGPYPEVIGTAIDMALNGMETNQQIASLIGRVTYGYGNRYFVEGNFRLDASTRFAPENRLAFFPSVSASWVMSNEPFFARWKQKTLSNVKFRHSVGLLGDQGSVDEYAYQVLYQYYLSSGYPIGGNFKPGLGMATYANPSLRWGQSNDYNIGTDLGFWSNRFEISYEYYWRYFINRVYQVSSYHFPPSIGANGMVPYSNYGRWMYWGWDLTLTHRNTIGKKFKYNTSFTVSKTDDRVLDVGDESSLPEAQRRAGKRSLIWLVYKADGLFQSAEEIAAHQVDQDGSGNTSLAPGDIRYVDVNTDGRIDKQDQVPVNNSTYPDMSYALKLGASYGNLFFNAMFQGVAGHQVLVYENYTLFSRTLQRFQDYHLTNTWTPDNPGAEYPRIKFTTASDNNRLPSTFWLKNCDFIRLKTLTIGYNVPSEKLRKAKINSLSISLQGMNLFTISNLKNGKDPETLGGYPVQRSYGLALNFGF